MVHYPIIHLVGPQQAIFVFMLNNNLLIMFDRAHKVLNKNGQQQKLLNKYIQQQ